MKFHQLVAFLFIIYTCNSICNAALATSETDDESADQSMIQEMGLRQPIYLLKRNAAADNFWQLYFRPTGYPQPNSYGQMPPLAYKDFRGKRASENYNNYKKLSRDTARLRQRFYNLLR